MVKTLCHLNCKIHNLILWCSNLSPVYPAVRNGYMTKQNAGQGKKSSTLIKNPGPEKSVVSNLTPQYISNEMVHYVNFLASAHPHFILLPS